MTRVAFLGTQLRIEDSTNELPDPVKEYLVIDDVIVVRMDTLAKSGDPQNVWAFESDGSLLWKIETAEPPSNESDPFTSISTNEGRLWSHNWNGYTYEIDLETGEIIGEKYVK